MNLGDLEFKAEDAEYERRAVQEFGCKMSPAEITRVESVVNYISIEKANRILKEKLEKAKQVFTTKVLTDRIVDDNRWYPEPQVDNIHGINWSTHTARLVCIEEIAK